MKPRKTHLAQERRAQNEVGIGIAEAALAYEIEGDPKYLEAAKRYLEAAVSYDVWGYSNNKPNVDLDFGDIFDGPATRLKQGAEYERSHPGGRFQSNYNVLYRFASRFHDGEAQGVAA